MTEKQAGTADVTLVVWVENHRAADYLLTKFAVGARSRGTLVVTDSKTESAPDPWTPTTDPPGLQVRLRYRHTCKNHGNHEWDAKRFFEKTFPEDDERFLVELQAVVLNSWEAVR